MLKVDMFKPITNLILLPLDQYVLPCMYKVIKTIKNKNSNKKQKGQMIGNGCIWNLLI